MPPDPAGALWPRQEKELGSPAAVKTLGLRGRDASQRANPLRVAAHSAVLPSPPPPCEGIGAVVPRIAAVALDVPQNSSSYWTANWIALDEIYQIYTLLHLSKREMSTNIRQTCSHCVPYISEKSQKVSF